MTREEIVEDIDDTKGIAWDAIAQKNAKIEHLKTTNAELLEALDIFIDAYTSGMNEPLVIAHEHAETVIAKATKETER